ncbi:hypothetical protein GCM10028802_26580 [Terrabacter terrigena]
MERRIAYLGGMTGTRVGAGGEDAAGVMTGFLRERGSGRSVREEAWEWASQVGWAQVPGVDPGLHRDGRPSSVTT